MLPKTCAMALTWLAVLTIVISAAGTNAATKQNRVKSKRPLPLPLSDYAMATNQKAKLSYFTGGCTDLLAEFSACKQTSNIVWKYDWRKDKYQSLDGFAIDRSRHGAGIIKNKLVVFGGARVVPEVIGGNTYFTESNANFTEEYDFKLRTWTSYPGGPMEDLTDFVTFTMRGKLYAAGGYKIPYYVAQTSVYEYVGDGKWIVVANLAQSRGDAFVTVIKRKAFIAGGWSDEDNFISPKQSIEMFDPVKGTSVVSPSAELETGRGDAAFCSTGKGRLYVFGGETGGYPPSMLHQYEYTQRHGSHPLKWRTKDLGSASCRFSCISVDGKRVRLFGGQIANTTSNTFSLSDTVTEFFL